MGKTSYYSVNGRLLGEATSGAETTYMTDALGSTIGTVKSTGLQNRYVYTPYGGLLQRTGRGPDPRFLWNGRSGSRSTNRAHAENYNRRRHYSSTDSRWTSADSLLPDEPAYIYASGCPTSFTDPTGENSVRPCNAAEEADAEMSCFREFHEGLLPSTCFVVTVVVNLMVCSFSSTNVIYTCWGNPHYGDCDPVTGWLLQEAVNGLCKGSTGPHRCGTWMTCDQLLINLLRFEACIAARKAINDRCFKGGDPGHNTAIANEERGANRCARLYVAKGCLTSIPGIGKTR